METMKYSYCCLCVILTAWLCGCTGPPPKIALGHWESLGAYSVGRVYRVAYPVWVWRGDRAELGHGVSTLPKGEGSLNRLYSPVMLSGNITVRVVTVKMHFAPAAGGWIATPVAMILSEPLRGQQVTLGTDGSWSVMDRDEQNQITFFKPKPGKVIRL